MLKVKKKIIRNSKGCIEQKAAFPMYTVNTDNLAKSNY